MRLITSCLLLLCACYVSAGVHPKINNYQFAIRIWCGDNVAYLIHTNMRSPGVKITPAKNITLMDNLIFMSAHRTGTAYDWQDCEFSIAERL